MIALVCNPRAGKGSASSILRRICNILDLQNQSYSIFDKNWPEGFKGFDALWLIGGDGTLNHFINKYPKINLPIALFKGGSGNDFAWKLYGNMDLENYAELALHGNPKPVDLGICNDRYFLNGVGIGFDAEVVKTMGEKRILPGHLAYLLTVIQKIFFYREIDLEIKSGDFERSGKLFMISLANGSRYGGGFLVAPQASVSDSELDIVLIRRISPWKRILHLPKVSAGSHLKLPFVEQFRDKEICIRASTQVYAHRDGELIRSNSFDIQLAPWKILFYY